MRFILVFHQTVGLTVSSSRSSILGTTNYMAPELFERAQAHVDFKADVWSFGCLLVELFGVRHAIPYSSFNAAAIPFQITQGNPPPEASFLNILSISHFDMMTC